MKRRVQARARANARIVQRVKRDVLPRKTLRRTAELKEKVVPKVHIPAHPVHSKSTLDVASMVSNGKFPRNIICPETFIDVGTSGGDEEMVAPTGLSSMTTPLLPMPNLVTGCSTISRKRTVQVVVGSGGVANLVILDPNMMANSDLDTIGVTTSAYAATDSPTGLAETGMTYGPGDVNSPYTSQRILQDSGGGSVAIPNFFWTPYVTITLKSNSSALTAKQGRLYMGACYFGEGFNATSAQFDQLQTFQNWGVDQVSANAMPVFRWIPTSYWEICSTGESDNGRLYPSIVITGLGLVANTVLEFELEYASVVASALIQFSQDLEYNTDAIQGVLHGMRKSLPKGFSHTVGQTKKAKTEHEHETAVRALRDQPVLPTIVEKVTNSKPGNLIQKLARDAIDAIPSFLGKLF